jgi:predicted RNA-binding Zn-ribbon protein involved in translation (DUF1610 family)
MEDNPHLTEIKKNLIHYLAVSTPCPNCGTKTIESLDTLYNQIVSCPQCKADFHFHLQPSSVVKLAESYQTVHKELQTDGAVLYFVYKPSPKSRSDDSTS